MTARHVRQSLRSRLIVNRRGRKPSFFSVRIVRIFRQFGRLNCQNIQKIVPALPKFYSFVKFYWYILPKMVKISRNGTYFQSNFSISGKFFQIFQFLPAALVKFSINGSCNLQILWQLQSPTQLQILSQLENQLHLRLPKFSISRKSWKLQKLKKSQIFAILIIESEREIE